MLQNKKTNLFYALTVISLSTLIVVSVVYAVWTEPPLPPPGGNASEPLNISTTTQSKAGALGIGGVFRAYSDAIFDGNVGIGTTTSTEKLIVQSLSDGRGVININQVGADNWSGLKIDRDGLEKWFIGVSAANDNLRLRRDSASDDLVIDAGGDVGIGTTTPAYKLDVNGVIRASGGFIFPDDTSQVTAAGSFWAPSSTDIYNTNVGNVGIGTDAPAAKLEVNGAIRITPLVAIPFACAAATEGSIYYNSATDGHMMCRCNPGCAWVDYTGPAGPQGPAGVCPCVCAASSTPCMCP